MKLFIAVCLFFAVFILGAANAGEVTYQLGEACLPIDQAHDYLIHQFGEQLVSETVINGLAHELWANFHTGTYTVLAYPGSELACMLLEGVADKQGTAI